MNIKFKSKQELLQITNDSKIKNYDEHNESYLKYINDLVEAQAGHGTTTYLDFDSDWLPVFKSCAHSLNLPQDDRLWYQLITDLEILLKKHTDWKVAVMKRKYINGTDYDLTISWGGN